MASRAALSFVAALTLLGVGLLAPACGDNSATGTAGSAGSAGSTGTAGSGPDLCKGGVVVNGVCEGKCKPELCGFEGNTCVGNRCALKCDSHADCYPDGSQSCVSAKEDTAAGLMDGADVMVCQFTGKPAGQGTACPFGIECANWLACPDGGTCFASQCGGMPAACVRDDAACGKDASCTIGKCPDGSGCRSDCAANCKPWLECVGSGEGDADAYCTSRDCQTDDDCLGGFYCGIVRDPHSICGSNPQKGNNKFCGKTAEPCVPVGVDGKATDGSTRFEGSVCMLRKSCIKRDTAAPCTTDLDCSLVGGQACVNFAGETRCAHKCQANLDCEKDSTCDTTLGACVPRFGAWKGMGGGFCEPCLNDEDCGTKGTTWACASLSGNMRACFDESYPDTCMGDLDCPKSPSGKHGTCLNDSLGLGPGDPNYDRCYLPINVNTDNKTTCW